MRLFKISIGNIEKLAVGKDEQDIYERKAEIDHTFDYLPVTIEEVTVEGHTITVTPDAVVSKRGKAVT